MHAKVKGMMNDAVNVGASTPSPMEPANFQIADRRSNQK